MLMSIKFYIWNVIFIPNLKDGFLTESLVEEKKLHM